MPDPGTFVCTEATVARMAMIAFGLKPYQLPGSSLDSGPSFEVVARVSKGATQAAAGRRAEAEQFYKQALERDPSARSHGTSAGF